MLGLGIAITFLILVERMLTNPEAFSGPSRGGTCVHQIGYISLPKEIKEDTRYEEAGQ